MKKLLTLMIAGSALAVAAPAAAQYSNQGYANVNAGGVVGIGNRIAQLDARLEAGVRSGAISRQEAQNLRPQLRQLRQLERHYSRNGFTQWERQDLQQRLRSLRQQVRMADGRGYGQDTRYGSVADRYDDEYDDDGRYGRDARYGSRDGRYGDDRYDDGRYDRDSRYGRSGDGRYGQGGPYQEVDEVCETRGGLGGVIDRVIGRGDNCVGLQVGQRVSGNLYGVPSQYRYQYRDGNGVYYRSDGRQIYQIDARTNTVIRIYGM